MRIISNLRNSVAAFTYGLIWLFSGVGNANADSILMNGASCVPYPPYGSSNIGSVPIQHWLYGFSGSAYCHFDLHNNTRAVDINYVVVNGGAPSVGPVRLRLCTYRIGMLSTSCGSERTMHGSNSVALLSLPSLPNSEARGAFVLVRFPRGGVSVITSIVASFRS